jgi:3-hydroxybutyryl-CoA dehydrogenase
MGAGIAQLCIKAGLETVGLEVTSELAERGAATVDRGLGRDVERERLTMERKQAALALLHVATELTDLAGCDFVIEAALEDLDVKRALFAELERAVSAEAVLATNTSAISVTAIAAATRHPERVVGMHFFNPAPVLPLVEIVRAERSSSQAVEGAFALALRLGKDPIRCRDTPGFVVNRILIPIMNDAVRVLDEGTATPEDIDKGMQLGTAWPMGPLALLDLVGIDVQVHAANALFEAYREPRFAPPPRLVRMVEAGLLGRKTGRGFYTYHA